MKQNRQHNHLLSIKFPREYTHWPSVFVQGLLIVWLMDRRHRWLLWWRWAKSRDAIISVSNLRFVTLICLSAEACNVNIIDINLWQKCKAYLLCAQYYHTSFHSPDRADNFPQLHFTSSFTEFLCLGIFIDNIIKASKTRAAARVWPLVNLPRIRFLFKLSM